jgi:2-iminobutanoate/2-iminopropanoate deaminase
MRETIKTDNAPAAIGPYAQAIKANGFVFTAGQGGVDPSTGKLVAGGVEAQTEQTMKNLAAILKAAGTSLRQAVKTTVFLTDIANFAAMNKVYQGWVKESPPARSTVAVKDLPLGALVEIEVVAVVP